MYIHLTVQKDTATHPIIEKLITPIKNFSEINTVEKLIVGLVELQIKEHNQKISHPPQPGKFILPTIHYLPYLLPNEHSLVMHEYAPLVLEEVLPLVQQAFQEKRFSIQLPQITSSWTDSIALEEGQLVIIIKNTQ